MPSVFDPAYELELDVDALRAAQTLRVQSTEPLVLTAPGAVSHAPGYREIQVPGSGDLFLNADVVRIEGRITLRGRAVQINARVLELAPGRAGEPPGIDVSGAPGGTPDGPLPKVPRAKDGHDAVHTYNTIFADDYKAPQSGICGNPGADGKAGAAGRPGGWIVLACARLAPVAGAAAFELLAAGGAGSAGQAGQAGQDGGNGGRGSDAWHGGINDTWEATDGASAGAGGAPGRGGPGGPGGKGGSVQVFSISPAPASLQVVTHVNVGSPGAAGADGARGRDGIPGKGGNSYQYSPDPDGIVWTTLPAGRPGGVQAPKDQPAPTWPKAPQPEAGTATLRYSCAYTDVAASARADHLDMLLAQIRHDGLALDREDDAAVRALAERVGWLLGVSGAYPAGGREADGAARVGAAAGAMAATLRDPRLDWFGHPPGWAPTVSLSQYASVLEQSLALFEAAEAAWSAYRSARDGKSEAAQQLGAAEAAANGQLDAARREQEAARGRMAELAQDISARADTISTARQAVLDAKDRFVAAVEKYKHFSFENYLEVIEQTAFAMSDPASAGIVYGTEEIKFWKGTFMELPGDDGKSVSKDYVVRSLDVYGDTVKDLDEAFTAVGGAQQPGDKDAHKLLCTQKALDELVGNFHAVEGADDVKDAMDEYVSEVTLRNTAILDYNAARAKLVQQLVEEARLRAHADGLEARAVKAAPPAVDRSVQTIYDWAKAACAEDLYRTARAYRFWTLRDVDIFREVLECHGPADVTSLQVRAGRARLLEHGIEDLEHFVGALQPRRDPVTVSFEAGRRVRERLARDRGVDANGVARAHFWEFNLEPALPETEVDDNPFAGMANVRLVEVRAWLIGLEPPRGRTLKVHLTHLGNEQVVSPAGDLVVVEHDPVEKLFEYAGEPESAPAIETRAVYWDHAPVTPGHLPDHTPVGPFGRWRVGLRPQDLGSSVDWQSLLAGLSEIRLEFLVRFQGFSTLGARDRSADRGRAEPLPVAHAPLSEIGRRGTRR